MSEPFQFPKTMTTVTHARIERIFQFAWDFALLALLAGFLVFSMLVDVLFQPGFLGPVRMVLGLAFILFAPGYALQAALFPRRSDQTGVARVGLAIGLSLCLLPPLALVLDTLPWGLRPWPSVIGLILIMLLCALVAVSRRLHLPVHDQSVFVFNTNLKRGWANLDRSTRRLYAIIAAALLLAVLSAAAIFVLPGPGERFTEFYLLGPGGQAQDYPRQGQVGQPLSVTVGIHNLEGVSASYRVEVHDAQGLIGQAGPLSLDDGGKNEFLLTITPHQTGDAVEVTFLLFRDHQSQPYRWLRLNLDIKPSP